MVDKNQSGANKFCGAGKSRAFQKVLDQAGLFARVPRPILIRGERGTGKELLARYIHDVSGREAGPYVAVNCAAFQETLFLSEMFGHEKGAFTGAIETTAGKLERADGGTLFLDEVGNMSRKAQEKLLRVIESKRFARVGGVTPIDVDVRLIAATNAPLEKLMQENAFLPDLYDRLCFAELTMPPLRKRPDDIPVLVEYIVDQLHHEIPNLERKSFTPSAIRTMQRFRWPGNIRQLKNVVERLYIFDADGEIHAAELPLEMAAGAPAGNTFYAKVAAFEKRLLLTALNEKDGNQRAAAKLLGMSYDQFRHYYKKYQLASLLA